MVGAKVTRLEAGGSEYTLFCSCDAYLQLEEAVGPDVFGGLKELGKLLRAAEILSEAGELLRRDYHYTPRDWFRAPPVSAVTPALRTALYRAAMEAVGYGLTNEVPQQAEVDLYLLEDQKKTGAAGQEPG